MWMLVAGDRIASLEMGGNLEGKRIGGWSF
jgi:hypothetical protein